MIKPVDNCYKDKQKKKLISIDGGRRVDWMWIVQSL
jgi:hypothetical protein